MINTEKFERHMREIHLSENTISSYLFAVRQFSNQYEDMTQKNLRAYKVWLIESYKPKTVNPRLRAINCYLESIDKEKWKLSFVRVQQKAVPDILPLIHAYLLHTDFLFRDSELQSDSH